MVKIYRVKNPRITSGEGTGMVLCEVEIKEGDGVGARKEWVEYCARPRDVAATGNQVWAMLCAGDFTCDEGHVPNFDHTELEPDEEWPETPAE